MKPKRNKDGNLELVLDKEQTKKFMRKLGKTEQQIKRIVDADDPKNWN